MITNPSGGQGNSTVVREWPFDIDRRGRRLPSKPTFVSGIPEKQAFFSKMTILSTNFYKFLVRNKHFVSTKYRKQTLFFANFSAPPHKYQVAAPLVSLSVCPCMACMCLQYDTNKQKTNPSGSDWSNSVLSACIWLMCTELRC